MLTSMLSMAPYFYFFKTCNHYSSIKPDLIIPIQSISRYQANPMYTDSESKFTDLFPPLFHSSMDI